MKVTVVIPTLNAGGMFAVLLEKLKHQSLTLSQIVIIDSSSVDDTVMTARQYGCHTETIMRSVFNHADTRNMALGYEADYYLLMTQDAVPYDADLVENLLHAFDDEDVVVAYARQIPHENADPIERFARATNYPEKSVVKSKKDLAALGIKTFFSSDSCAMYRSDYFHRVGGFKSGLETNEDMEFAARAILAGKKIAYVAGAKVYHSHHFTFMQVWRRYAQIGRFFAANRWILDEAAKYSRAESTGLKQALKELKYLFKNAPLSIPRSILLSITKYIAFKSGF